MIINGVFKNGHVKIYERITNEDGETERMGIDCISMFNCDGKTSCLCNQYYVLDELGYHEDLFRRRVKKVINDSYARRKETVDTCEAHVPPLMKVFENWSHFDDTPPNVMFFDIEVDADEEGYSDVTDTRCPIISIGYWTRATGSVVMILLDKEFKDREDELKKNGIRVYTNEEKMITGFLDAIQENSVDVLSGWNSEAFDIPYIVNRIKKISNNSGKMLGMLSFSGNNPPSIPKSAREKGKIIYYLHELVHLDYMVIYKKNYPSELDSYKLDNVASIELGYGKIDYDGKLFELYRKDPLKFAEYNKRDVEILVELEKKMKYIQNTYALAHMLKVPPQKTLGTVSKMEQALRIECHKNGFVVPDKNVYRKRTEKGQKAATLFHGQLNPEEKGIKAVGAYVFEPKKGMHDLVSSMDINSLYPSIIRTLNMSPETIVGQVDLEFTRERLSKLDKKTRSEEIDNLFFVEEYEMIMNRSDEKLKVAWQIWHDDRSLDFHWRFLQKQAMKASEYWGEKIEIPEDGKMKASDLYKLVFFPESRLHISAICTLFRTDFRGIIPSILEKWYEERTKMKKRAEMWSRLAFDGIPVCELAQY